MTGIKKEPDLSVFRARLRLAMRRKKITQGELAEQAGVSRATVSRWLREGSDHYPNSHQSFGLGDLLGVGPRWLWGMTADDRKPEYLSEDEHALLRAFRTMARDEAKALLDALTEGYKAVDRAKKKASA